MTILRRKSLQAEGLAFGKVLNWECAWHATKRTRSQCVWNEMDKEEKVSGWSQRSNRVRHYVGPPWPLQGFWFPSWLNYELIEGENVSRNTQYQCLNGIENHGTEENYQETGVHHESKEDYGQSQRVLHNSREVSSRVFLYLMHAQCQVIQLQNLSGFLI